MAYELSENGIAKSGGKPAIDHYMYTNNIMRITYRAKYMDINCLNGGL